MHVLVAGGEDQQKELNARAIQGSPGVESIPVLSNNALRQKFNAIIDLGFQHDKENIGLLQHYPGSISIVNSVIRTLDEFPNGFVRINGWPGFLSGPIIEAAAKNEKEKKHTEEVFALFGKKIEWVNDLPGFISPRVLSMIINEAYFALADGVSGKEEIDTAMKLGTHYPEGPFEWSRKIGLKNIADLLTLLSVSNARYQPAALLLKESLSV